MAVYVGSVAYYGRSKIATAFGYSTVMRKGRLLDEEDVVACSIPALFH